KNNRTKILWKLAVLDILSFSAGLVALTFFLPQSALNILSWIFYDLLITYVLCIEVPAYLKISNFDDNLSGILKGLRKELIDMQFSFGVHLQSLKSKRNDNISYLKGENLDKLLEDFIAFSDRIGNLNEKVWSLTLGETSSVIDEVTKRSKHPFPKLIDILALSGLSLLLAQFLKLFG
ncbi:hypothetical protein MUP77_12690, partial [Candidatus Bathyarchaeota archaeon]|nr:hypothetical protein [Candidatus Bathyarchaeota archaeon]